VKDVLRSVKSFLKEDGFYTSIHGVLLRPICPGFEMFVGLNTATHRGDGVIGINPVVGLRDSAVENLIAELAGHRGSVTLSISLGYLMPERRYVEWEFGTADPVLAASLRDNIRMFGYPLIESLASRGAVADALKDNRMTFNESRAYRLPVVYFLQGKKDLLIQDLRNQLDAMHDRTDMAAMEYRIFAERLESKVRNAD
jgi:hypothetical protein